MKNRITSAERVTVSSHLDYAASSVPDVFAEFLRELPGAFCEHRAVVTVEAQLVKPGRCNDGHVRGGAQFSQHPRRSAGIYRLGIDQHFSAEAPVAFQLVLRCLKAVYREDRR